MKQIRFAVRVYEDDIDEHFCDLESVVVVDRELSHDDAEELAKAMNKREEAIGHLVNMSRIAVKMIKQSYFNTGMLTGHSPEHVINGLENAVKEIEGN